MLKPALTIQSLAQDPSWPEIKRRKAIEVLVDGVAVEVQLVGCPTRIGELLYFRCPRCGTKRRTLFLVGELSCRICHRLRHVDQQLSAGHWSRNIVRRVRQVRRIEGRLTRHGLDLNTRRRLRRRLKRLVCELQCALHERLSSELGGLYAQLANSLQKMA